MANSESSPTEYDYQVKACKIFFEDDLPPGIKPILDKDRPKNTKRFKGPVFDITRFDAQQVVSVLSDIVNDREKYTAGKTFYLLINSTSDSSQPADIEELYRLKARPTKHHPGNGVVFLRPRRKERFKQSAKSYEELNGALKAHYENDTKQFAKDIKQLLKNNVEIDDLPQPTFEVYMILLFEIARRLVKSDNPTETKKAYDVLPIGCAIARFLKLLELGKCHFEDVFFPGQKYHCFSKKPKVRRKAIDEINAAILDITKKQTASTATSGTTELETSTKLKDHLKELQILFCSDKRLAEMSSKEEEEKLATELKNLMSLISSEEACWSFVEYITAFDDEVTATCQI